MNRYDLNGKIAIVTGAGRGIGRAIALRLAASGAKTVVTDLDGEGCEAVLKEIRYAGGNADALRLDVSVEEEIKAVMAEVKNRFGRIDILVNNAGIYVQKEIEAMATEDIDRVISVCGERFSAQNMRFLK